jgi:[acyl-carrier-protein] S-malonyltransferase
MARAAPAGTTSMVAVLGLAPEAVEEALEEVGEAWPANYNTPSQTVVGGTVEGLEAAGERLRHAGARRLVPLNVSAAFHTPLMEPAAAGLRRVLDTVAWRAPAFPVVANRTAEPYTEAGLVAACLEEQLRSPVLWLQSVGRLGKLGCEAFLELGPRRALTGMMRELAPGAFAAAIGAPAALEALELP